MHSRMRGERLFLGAGLMTCVAIGFPPMVQIIRAGPAGARVATILGLHVAAVATFMTAFWWNTRLEGTENTSDPRRVFLLFVEAALGFFYATDFLFIVSAQVAFVLRERPATAWLAVQVVLSLAINAWMMSSREFGSLPAVPRAEADLGALMSLAAWQVFAFCTGLFAVTERRGRRELAMLNAEQRATQRLLADSNRLAERLHISRELHDSVGHHLTALSLNLELASHLASGSTESPVHRAQEITRLLLRDVRDVVSALRDERTVDLRRTLAQLLAGVEEPRVDLALPSDLEIRDHGQALVIFRCVQEALTNVVKHAQARHVWIDISRDDRGIRIQVRDDGRGARSIVMGNGLTGMRERVEGVGGTLDVACTPAQGVKLTIRLPERQGALE